MKRLAAVTLAGALLLGGVASAATLTRAQYNAQVVSSGKLTNLPAGLTPTLASMAGAGFFSNQGIFTLDACDPYNHRTLITAPVSCVLGNPNGSKTIALIGDSIAGNWAPGLDIALQSSDYKVIAYAFAGCPPLVMSSMPAALLSGSVSAAQCATWHTNVFKQVAAAHPVAVLVSIAPWGTGVVSQAAWNAAVKGTFNAISTSPSVRRILLGGSTIFKMDVSTCLAARKNPSACSVTIAGSLNPGIRTRDAATATAVNAKYVSASPYLCSPTLCDAVVGTNVTVVDKDHFTIAFARSLSPWVGADVLAALK